MKSEVPPEVFTTEWKNPVNTASGDFRKHQQRGDEAARRSRLEDIENGPASLTQRGAANHVRTHRTRCSAGPTFERIVLPYVAGPGNARHQGHARASSTAAQYKRREDKRDFDIIVDNFAPVAYRPATSSVEFWGSAAADTEGSRNTIGIKNPAIDKLIDKIVFAKDRADLVAATHALDRVLLWNFYVVPHWHYPYERVAYWDMFGRPAKTAVANLARMMQTWWFDADKAKAIARRRGEMSASAGRDATWLLQGALSLAAAFALIAPVRGNTSHSAEPRHGLSVFGELKYRAGLQAFRLRQPGCAQGRQHRDHGHGRRNDVRHASTASSSRATRRRASNSCSTA